MFGGVGFRALGFRVYGLGGLWLWVSGLKVADSGLKCGVQDE